MNTTQQTFNPVGIITNIIFPILILVALYYLYKFLFSSTGLDGRSMLNGIKDANPDKGYITIADSLPAIYEGGEYSINGWIYINDYAVNRGMNKHVFSLGGSSFLTLACYLGPYKNSLNIRVHTKTEPVGAVGAVGAVSASATDDLSIVNLPNIFGSLQQDNGLLNSSKPCDIQSIDLQKWVQITIVLNNKTCDVYLDGKLARSCILPSFYKVDKSNMAMRICEYGGFGGHVSNFSAYNYALNPEQVWKLYMSGPGSQYGVLDYLKSLFDPNALGALDYPKQNITP